MVKKGVLIEILTILWLFVEAGVAIGTGVATHSLSLVAFGADSIIEFVSAFVLLWRLWIEMKQEALNKVEHAEKVASWVVGIALLLLALYIVITAVLDLFRHNSAESNILGIALAVAASALMPVIAFAKKRIGKAIKSKALEEDGKCSMVCAYMSWVLIIGLIFNALLKLWWIDSVISIVLVIIVVKEGIEAIQEAREKEED